jgi:arylsulfatase A-like enzyme
MPRIANRYHRPMLDAIVLTAMLAREQPNIVFIYSDDHAAAAVGAYDSKIIDTPNIDRIAEEGVVFENAFCTNGICAPARAVVLTGLNSHHNGIIDNATRLDPTVPTFPSMLQRAGYQTAMIGKWHLRSDPVGFDHWDVLPGQGHYYQPDFRSDTGKRRLDGYVTDITTDLAIDWLNNRNATQPFMLMVQHKAPHRNWMPGPDHLTTFDGKTIPEPATLHDDWAGRPAAQQQEMTIAEHMHDFYDLKITAPHGDVHTTGPDKWMHDVIGRMTPTQQADWEAAYQPRNEAYAAAVTKINQLEHPEQRAAAMRSLRYQRYIKDYLRCIASVDDNVGRLLDYLDANNLTNDTIVIYTSDQGFFLGEHGWYDKRFMYEPSLRFPLVMRWPNEIPPGTRVDALVQNLDFAPTFLDVASATGTTYGRPMEGATLAPLMRGETPTDWRSAILYEYYEPMPHAVAAHRGIRTDRWKLMYFPDLDSVELYDLQADPNELHNLAGSPDHQAIVEGLTKRLEHGIGTQFTTTRAPFLNN